MASIPQKVSILVSNSAISSEQLSLDFHGASTEAKKQLEAQNKSTKNFKDKNAFRVEAIKIQIDDLDAEAADDLLFKIQLAYQDLNASTHLTIDDEDEILTLAKRLDNVGDATGSGLTDSILPDAIRDSGILLLDGKDFKDCFICESKCYINCSNSGQDAAEVFHIEIFGNYVHLTNKSNYRNKVGITG